MKLKGEYMRHMRRIKRNPFKEVTEKKIIGKFNDFDSVQQRKIIENYYNINIDHDWWDYTVEDFTKILELLGFNDIKINFSGFSSQGDGASFTGKFVPGNSIELKRRLKRLNEYAKEVPFFNYLDMKFDRDEMEEGIVKVYRTSHRYLHENTISSDNEDLLEFARAFSRYIYREIEKEYDYLTSAEAIQETLLSNDYDFDVDTLKIY